MIKVFGHTPPDTDTVGSAILWAWHLNTFTSQKAQAFSLGDLNKETAFVLNRWRIPEPEVLEKIEEGDEVVIVDTNNPQELPADILKANILNIIDHHKLVGGLITKRPLEMTLRPLACTATIIFDLMEKKAEDLPEEIAGLMLSCILSDTLAFRSVTTTSHDKDVAEKLAERLNIDIEKYSDEMFTAKSDISDFTDIGLVHLDSKKYAVGDKNIRVSVMETTKPELVLGRKEGIKKAMEELSSKDSELDDVLFFVIDILKEEATALVHNDFTKSIIEESFGVSIDEDTEVLPGILSRKKQIVPVLCLPE